MSFSNPLFLGPRRAFTAFEALLATTILALVSIAVSSALTAGRQESRAAQNSVYGAQLARAMMDEILRFVPSNSSKTVDSNEYFRRNGGTSMNNLGAYNGYTDGVGTSITSIVDIAGNAYPAAYQNFTRTVTISATTLQPNGWALSDPGSLITITVTQNGQTVATLQRYISPN